jgi:hypothetical protein
VAERAASVRTLIGSAIDGAFGATPDEQLLREVLKRGYLDAATKHDNVAAELRLSRTAYYRRLHRASDRLAAWLSGTDGR